MKTKDLVNLLNRAAACIETPGDLTSEEISQVAEDLVEAAKEIEHDEQLD